jgi:hypothetical protein
MHLRRILITGNRRHKDSPCHIVVPSWSSVGSNCLKTGHDHPIGPVAADKEELVEVDALELLAPGLSCAAFRAVDISSHQFVYRWVPFAIAIARHVSPCVPISTTDMFNVNNSLQINVCRWTLILFLCSYFEHESVLNIFFKI